MKVDWGQNVKMRAGPKPEPEPEPERDIWMGDFPMHWLPWRFMAFSDDGFPRLEYGKVWEGKVQILWPAVRWR